MEVWKDIKGFEGFYQVSNYGRVKSLDRIVNRVKKGNVLYKGKILSQRILKNNKQPNKAKYYMVGLSKDGKTIYPTVHKLVITTFNPIVIYETINHKDGNGLNNHIDNLEYMSNVDNVQHWLSSVGKNIKKVRNKETGQVFQSIRAASKQILIDNGIENITDQMIRNMWKNVKKHNNYEII